MSNKWEKTIEILERDVRSIDDSFPLFIIGTGAISAGYTFLSFWITTASGWFPSRTTQIIMLILPSYLLVLLFIPLFLVRKARAQFLDLLLRFYSPEKRDEKVAKIYHDLRYSASRVRRYWDQVILSLFLYLLVLSIVLIAYWSMYV